MQSSWHMIFIYSLLGQITPPQYHNIIPRQNLTDAQKNAILKSLAQYESEYDANVSMIKQNYTYRTGTPNTNYRGHTVHATRVAADYAVDLLDCEDSLMEKRAFDVLQLIDNMTSPDLNWADFIGTQLLQIAINQRERLPNDLAESLDMALIYAARLIQRRNVDPGYTNIEIMGTHVTIVTSEIYNLTDLNDYAMYRLRFFSNFTKRNGAFTEYNSPTYIQVTINELGRMKMHAILNEVEEIATELYHIAWADVAQHYHLPTGQWSGPHSRSYSTLLTIDTKNFISSSVNGTWDPRLPLPIPNDLQTYFVSTLIIPRSFNKTYSRDPLGIIPNLIGTTYLHPLFTIGSINWAEMWNQRRPLIAYWGTQEKPSYLQLRFLHDDYDFSDILYYSVQKEDRVLAGLVFATDGGDIFPGQDRIKNATIKANDLPIRFQIGGNDTNATCQIPQIPSDPIKFILNNISVQFALPIVLFSYHNQSGWSVTRANGTLNVDYVLYSSNVAQTIKLDTLAEAAAIVAVQISSNTSASMLPVDISQGSLLDAKWTDLCLSIPFKPNTVSQLRRLAKFGCS